MLCAYGIRIRATTTDERFAELQQLCKAADDKSSLAFGMAGMLHGPSYCTAAFGRALELASKYMTLVESIGEPTLTVLLAFVCPADQAGDRSDRRRTAMGPGNGIDLGEGDPLLRTHGGGSLRGAWLGPLGPREPKVEGRFRRRQFAMARGTDPMVQGYVVSVTYSPQSRRGVMLADDEAYGHPRRGVACRRAIQRRSSRWAWPAWVRDSLCYAETRLAERERGAAVLAQVREMILAKRFYASELPVVEAWLAREMAATGDRDRALPMIRNAVNTLFDTGQWGYLSATAGVLVDTLLARGKEGDIDEADRVIQRLATGPDEGLLYREVWLSRSRALVARARGQEIRYDELARRYRDLATSLGYEGHMAMAEAMSPSGAEKSSAGVVPSPAGSAVSVTGDGIPRGRIREPCRWPASPRAPQGAEWSRACGRTGAMPTP